MTSIFKKLNLKDQSHILVVNVPPSFEPEIEALGEVTILRQPDATTQVDFAIAFVTQKAQVETMSAEIAKCASGDAILWFAYPKKSSKKYQADIYRDDGWDPLTDLGFAPVRQVAIDENWSALRFRREEYIRAHKKNA